MSFVLLLLARSSALLSSPCAREFVWASLRCLRAACTCRRRRRSSPKRLVNSCRALAIWLFLHLIYLVDLSSLVLLYYRCRRCSCANTGLETHKYLRSLTQWLSSKRSATLDIGKDGARVSLSRRRRRRRHYCHDCLCRLNSRFSQLERRTSVPRS